MSKPDFDPVLKPEHYAVGGIETIDVIKAKLTPEQWIGYCLGNVLKYTTRHAHKSKPKEDLLKGEYYLKRLIEAYGNDIPEDLDFEKTINDLVNEWYQSSDESDITIEEFLGVSGEDYSAWVTLYRDGSRQLPSEEFLKKINKSLLKD